MELRHLRYFVAVAEEGHVTRAAERLGIQQPPLSLQIRALEREVGAQLFRRRPRGMELTAAGRAFFTDAQEILQRVDHAFASTRRTARGEQGRIAIGFTNSAPFHPFVPRVIRAFRDGFPLVALNLEESGTSELVEALRAERLDAVFVRSSAPDYSGLAVHFLMEEKMMAALPAGHRLAANSGAKPLDLAALNAEPFVLYRRLAGPGFYDAIITACRDAGFNPTVVQEAPRILSTLNLVAAGLGISIVPASLQRMQMDGVVYRRLKTVRKLVAPLSLAVRRGEPSPAVGRFVDLVRKTAKAFR
ncbi:MAG: LysR family transcriptional regulator [Alphaproteobacteria bacterium]|nr:LysR family transcriptional regulator [Alphaproteobacteria bacterium]